VTRAALYLALLLGGIVSLIRALYVTRASWRTDVAPYGRRSRPFQILLHPGNYATAERLREIRWFSGLGAALLCGALLVVLYDAFTTAS
jgi:hypothetical protein